MATRRASVLLHGVIKGNGQEVECKIAAIKNTLEGGGIVAFSEYSIMRSSHTESLAQGRYKVWIKETSEEISVRKDENGEFVQDY